MSEFTGNWFAALAVLGWPLVSAFLYNSLTASRATIWTILGGYLLLPSNAIIKFAMIPALDKNSIPSICAGIGCLVFSPKGHRATASKLLIFVTVLFLLSPLVTSALNSDLIFLGGGQVLPGVGYYDAISTILYQSIFFLPFLLGWRYFRTAADTEAILRALIVAGLFYSLPMLFEIRMSPQLSIWIYGIFPSTFLTEARYGGFRPVVFLTTGLELSFFIMTTMIAAVAIWRAKSVMKNIPLRGAATYLAIIVMLSKSAGALIYTVVGGATVFLAKPQMIARVAKMLVIIALVYPLLRAADLFPTDTLVSVASAVNEDRGSSLKTRFDQEDSLLARAAERPVFGWGRYGRSRVYSEQWGSDITLSDGFWIITLGSFGITGFLTLFGLLTLPVFRTVRALQHIKSEPERVMLSSLALIVALTVVEQIPNSSISPWSWLLAGALLARIESLASPQHEFLRPKLERQSRNVKSYAQSFVRVFAAIPYGQTVNIRFLRDFLTS
jgi:hypothetical protein